MAWHLSLIYLYIYIVIQLLNCLYIYSHTITELHFALCTGLSNLTHRVRHWLPWPCFPPYIWTLALWADAFYKSVCPSVCVSACLCICLCVCSILRYRLNVFLPPFPEVGCPNFLEIQNSWGKVMERSGLTFKNFYY